MSTHAQHTQVVLSLTLLWKYLGASILTGMAVMLVLIPINVVVAGVQKKLQVCVCV